MKHITPEVTTYTVELTKAEVKLIRGLTQNYDPKIDNAEAELYKELFVGMSRILGYDMADDGTIKRGSL